MSFYSYKNANPTCCPGTISGSALDGLQEKVCVQVKRVYDSAMTQEQLSNQTITITSYAQVSNTCTCNACGCQETQETVTPTTAPVTPITFESCRSTSTEGTIRNLTVDRLCDRPCFARVRATIDIPIDILFVDSRCVEYIGKAVISVSRDVLLSIPDESIVPYTLESMVSAICVSGTYLGNNQFCMTICVTTILKVLAEAELLIPSYGYCPIPPAEEFAESVCDEFFALPLFPPQSACNSGTVSTGSVTSALRTGCGCNSGCTSCNGSCGCNNSTGCTSCNGTCNGSCGSCNYTTST